MFNTFIRTMYLLAYGALTCLRKLLLCFIIAITASAGARADEIFTIVAFGDSLTRGYGLPEDQGLVPQLQVWLNKNGGENIAVVNAGVSGDTTAGGLARIEWTLTDDVDAVIVALGGNDMLRGVSPESSAQNLDGILERVTARGLPVMLVGIPAPTNFGPEYKTEFDGMFANIAEKYGALLYPYFFAGFGVGQDTAAIREWMQDDATHPNAAGVSKIVDHMGPEVLRLTMP